METESRMVVVRAYEEGEGSSSMGIGFQFCKVKKGLEICYTIM